MDFMQSVFSTPTKRPVLLCIPEFNAKGKENERPSVPLLQVNLSSGNNRNQGTNIFRLPAEYYNPLSISYIGNKTVKPAPLQIPKLIDIRSVLKNTVSQNNSKVVQNPDLSKDVKLIKFPIIKSETRLLDSPQRKMSNLSKSRPVEKEEPQIVDIRPFTPQEPINLIDTKKIERKQRNHKLGKVTSRNTSRKPSTVSHSCSPNKYADTPTDEACSIVDEPDKRSYRKNRRNKKHPEEELYEVISELLMKRKKRKKKVKLFDIIDSIPLSSDSDADDDIPWVGKSRISRKENSRAKGVSANPIIPVSENIAILPSKLPDVPLDKFKPKSSKFISNYEGDNKPLSWADIIKTARQETQSTQTEYITNSKLKSQEIQTEMKDMVEIPRIQTFFKASHEADNSVKKTNEFCEHVRKEVVDKLSNIKRKEDKYCQTVCDAGIQTDEEIKELPADNHATNYQTKQTSEIFPHEKSRHSLLPPDIHTEVHFDRSTTNPKKNFINIVDLEMPHVDCSNSQPLHVSNTKAEAGKSDFFKLESIDEYMSRVVSKGDIETERTDDSRDKNDNQQEIDQPTMHQMSDNDEQEVSIQINDPPPVERSDSEAVLYNTSVKENEEQSFPGDLFSDIRSQGAKKKRKKKSKHNQQGSREVTGKTKLQNNITEFSVGLDALNDIHENLEKELKQSKFLFGMIETLQDGFMSDGSEEIYVSHSSPTASDAMDSQLPEVFVPTTTVKSNEELPVEAPSKDKSEEIGGLNEYFHEPTSTRTQMGGLLADKKLDFETYNIKNMEGNVGFNQVSFDSLDHPVPSHDQFGESLAEHIKNNEFLSSRNGRGSMLGDSKKSYGRKPIVVESEKDKLFKQELKKRICKTKTNEEVKLKQEKEKREKLLKWIKAKKSERQKEYLEDRQQKREAEHHPFISKKSVPGNVIQQNMSMQAQVTRCVLEENNQERLLDAEKLASTVISKKSSTHRASGRSPHGTHTNSRYKNTLALPDRKNKIPIRETRASKIRKTALVSDILKKQELHQSIAKRKGHRGGKDNPKKENKKSKSKKGMGSLKSSGKRGNVHRISGKNIGNFDDGGRRSVEAHEFVTRDSYDDYMMKSSILLQQTIDEYRQIDDASSLMGNVDFPKRLTSSRLSNLPKEKHINTNNTDLRYDEPVRKKTSNFSLNSSTDNIEVKHILKKYGMDVESGLFEKTSRTSQLLAEVELALLEESDIASENSVASGNIDWNEIDKILEE